MLKIKPTEAVEVTREEFIAKLADLLTEPANKFQRGDIVEVMKEDDRDGWNDTLPIGHLLIVTEANTNHFVACATYAPDGERMSSSHSAASLALVQSA